VAIILCAQSMDSALESWDSNGLDGVNGKGNDKANSQERQPFDGSFRHFISNCSRNGCVVLLGSVRYFSSRVSKRFTHLVFTKLSHLFTNFNNIW